MLRIAIIALAYVATAKLSLWLAIPPGYATALFPPAGVALAAVLVYRRSALPGIWLGSMALNLWIGYNNAQHIDVTSVFLAAGIGLGAALQAWAGATLVRRVVGYPATLDDMDSIVGFFLLGGPLACVINATMANLLLVFGGVLGWDNFFSNWFVWWTGDTIGVLIAAPWVLSFIGEPREMWRQRRAAVNVPSVITLAVVIVLFVRASAWEEDRIRFGIQQRADAAVNRLTTDFTRHLEALVAIRSFFAASVTVEPEEFKQFVKPMFDVHPGLRALEWVPHVSHANRPRFEQTVRTHIDAQFGIRERDATGALVGAAERADHYPVLYVEPLKSNQSAMGYDLGSDRIRRAAIERAIERRTPTATPPIELVQDGTDMSGILVLLQTYGRDFTQSTPVDGFAVGVFTIDGLITSALTPQDRRDFHVRVVDNHKSDHELIALAAQGRQSTTSATRYRLQIPFDLAGTALTMELVPVAGYVNEQRPWQAWGMLAGGLLFTSLLGAFLLFVTGQNARTASLVENRTRELNRAVTALSENESRLQAVLDTAGDGIITVNAAGHILSTNRAATQLFGRGATELHDQPLTTYFSAAGQQILIEFMSGRPQTSSATVAAVRIAEVKHLDGRMIPITLSVSEVMLASGRQFTVILHDMTEQRRIDELKNDFVATVSHELRTPLTSIRGSLGLILGGAFGAVQDSMRRMLDVAVQNADRLTLLINDILDIEKIESGALEFKIHPMPLRPLILHAIEINSGYAKTFGVEVKLTRDDSNGTPANVDPDRYAQVMTNLLSNAIKFSPRGATVDVTLTRENDWLVVAVSDHGPGIPEDFRRRIFQKFAQADGSSTRQHSGTGLGLSITKAIIDRLGGEIGFESTLGAGTVFHVKLPVARRES